MEPQFQKKLAQILRSARVAALGTLRHEAPTISLVAYAYAEDFSGFYMLTSELAMHTQDMQSNKNVSLLVTEADDGREDPLTLARVALRGQAVMLPMGEPGYMPAKKIYVERFPKASPLFDFGDFGLWRINVKGGRFIAGFGKAFNLTVEALAVAAQA